MKLLSIVTVTVFYVHSIVFSPSIGACAQCPPNYTLVGDRCLWFMSDLDLVYSDALQICNIYGGSLAKVDDCNLLGEIAQYIYANGEHTRDMSSNWGIIKFYDT